MQMQHFLSFFKIMRFEKASQSINQVLYCTVVMQGIVRVCCRLLLDVLL